MSVVADRFGTGESNSPKRLDALEDMSDNLKPGEPASVRVLRARRKYKIRPSPEAVKQGRREISPYYWLWERGVGRLGLRLLG